jgi:predicted GNAT superfamily acetyltransferase
MPGIEADMSRSKARPLAAPIGAEFELRALQTTEEYAACVRLQRETWGARYVDIVPASLLKVSQLVGGICAGALDENGELLGFVYGLTGLREGRLAHWSHMLAVAPAHRDHGIGRRLKEYQREAVRRQGIEVIYWTFDPLVARNAHLNLNCLGAAVQEYVPDMYGSTGSRLHAFGTDRFVLAWPVGPAPAAAAAASSAIMSRDSSHASHASPQRPSEVERRGGVPLSWRSAPLAGVDGRGAATSLATASRAVTAGEPLLRVEIPPDIEALQLAQAQAWRHATRSAFAKLLTQAYRVSGFYRDDLRCFYVLEKTESLTSC